jgi:hypothetical protein
MRIPRNPNPPPPVAPLPEGKDEWYTPPWLLDWLGPIALDPCWSPACYVQAATTLDIRRLQDGLADEWRPVGPGVVYCNPPFSNTSAWMAKAAAEAERLQRVVVALVPSQPGDNPWHKHVWHRAEATGFLAGRLKFISPGGVEKVRGRGHALVLYGPADDVVAQRERIRAAAARHPRAPVWVQEVPPWV